VAKIYSSAQIAHIVGVDPTSINRWIDGGRLKAFRTPGGHRRVLEAELVTFLNAMGMPLPESLQPAGLSFLVVDKEEKFLRNMSRAISRSDRCGDVETASSMGEGLLLLGAYQPDVLVLDLDMDDLGGPERCAQLAEHALVKHTLIIGSTGGLAAKTAERFTESGVALILTKPFKPAELLDAIE